MIFGTPVGKTAYGKGTFKTFGGEDDEGYLHRCFISSIRVGRMETRRCGDAGAAQDGDHRGLFPRR